MKFFSDLIFHSANYDHYPWREIAKPLNLKLMPSETQKESQIILAQASLILEFGKCKMSNDNCTDNFFEYPNGSNDVYNFNKTHPNRQEVRDYCSKLLKHHWIYCADNHFQMDAVENPQQRWWEMYLSWVLFTVGGLKGQRVGEEGPDFLAILPNGRKVWIEAIAVKAGEGNNTVHRPPTGQAAPLPVEKMVLRVTSAFADKLKKIETYRTKGIIGSDDSVVIAINTGDMRDSDLADQYPPLAVRALLGVGEAQFKVSVHLGEEKFGSDDIEMVFPEKKTVMKNERSDISTTGLIDNPIISAVFTSTRHLVDMAETGNDFKIILNPKASNPLEKDIFKFGTIIS